MKGNNIWLPLIASVGVGAATFYSMSKNNQDLGQTMQQFMPNGSGMQGQGQAQGHGQMQGQQDMNSNSGGNTEQLGPFGMS